ncbi:hypothetical protein OF83DRAFT_1032149, partial [Amylostereum chailletii]
MLSMLMKGTNQKCNALASVIGLFLHSSNVPERVIEVVSHVGLSIGVTAINNSVNSLDRDVLKKFRVLGLSLTAAAAYDNFDVAFNVATPTVENDKNLAHLTSGTFIPLEHGVTEADLDCS